jgi:hypothetical protein
MGGRRAVMDPGEIMKGLVTAELTGSDKEIFRNELTRENLPIIAGAAVAYVGNMVKIIAAMWEVEPAEAWEIILESARKLDMP